MRRVLIAGCGYVGTAAADLFHAGGWLVEGWTHSASSAAQLLDKPYPVTAVDLGDRQQVNSRAQNFDLVIHCASTGGGETDDYRRTFLEGVRNLTDRFVGSTLLFTSSTSVYSQRNGEVVTEEAPAEPVHERGRLLRETEALVLERGGVVTRLAGIHGPGRSAILTRFLRGEATADPNDDRYLNYIHRDDAAAALVLLAEIPARSNAIYNVTDDAPILRSHCFSWLSEKLGRPNRPSGRRLAVQSADQSKHGPAPAKRGRSSKRVSNAKLRALGWTPRFPSFAAAMEQSILPSFGL